MEPSSRAENPECWNLQFQQDMMQWMQTISHIKDLLMFADIYVVFADIL